MKSNRPTDNTSQERVLSFLSNPLSYNSGIQKVDRLETHGAYIFLAGDQVFKIKRAVSFSYMDFSTLERRHAACKREIELNKPHAPQIYKDLVSITEEMDGSLTFNGKGRTIEWLVQMVRFQEQNVLKNLASQAPLTGPLSQRIAEIVFSYHEDAPHFQNHRSVVHLLSTIKNVTQTLRSIPSLLEVKTSGDLESHLMSHYKKNVLLLERREQDGSVRRCHGDLHLSNIVLIEDKPVLFDALEFSEDMAIIDILYDLGFLLMDLDHSDQRKSANIIFNRYFWLSSKLIDIEGLQSLPLFLALRAAIRAMVRAQRALQAFNEERASLFQISRQYVDRALSYLTPRSPTLILIGGFSGTGKSTLASALAPLCGQCPGALHLRSDLERKRLFSVAETDRLPEDFYTPEINDRVYSMMLKKADLALSAGHSVIADAVYSKPNERNQMERLAQNYNAKLYRFWLEAPLSVLLTRVANRTSDASDASEAVVMKQREYDIGPLDWTRIEAHGSPADVFTLVKENLKEYLESA